MIGIPAKKGANPDDIWENNFEKLIGFIDKKSGDKLNNDLYEHYLEEIGIESIVKYLEIQDKIEELNNISFASSSIDNALFFESKLIDYHFDEEDITKDNDKDYNIEAVRNNLLKHFLNNLANEIPKESVFTKQIHVTDFIKMFQIKFLHEIVIPVSEMDDEDFQN